MKMVILTYHSNNVSGTTYASNDHVALAEDLRTIERLGLPIVPLRDAVDAMFVGKGSWLYTHMVALTCDDGSWFDWHDLPHPSFGTQVSFKNIIGQARDAGQQASLTSFVIASPKARKVMDERCLIGQGWWGDEWWADAAKHGVDVQNHSWDHNHDCLDETCLPVDTRGHFRDVSSWAEADAELRQASDFIDAQCGAGHSRLLAYPYGECNDYLVNEYLPNHQSEHRLQAAFTTEPEPVTPQSNRWALGRYVCGQHWQSAEGLEALLREALG